MKKQHPGAGESEAMTTGQQSANLRLAIESEEASISTLSASGLKGRAKDEEEVPSEPCTW